MLAVAEIEPLISTGSFHTFMPSSSTTSIFYQTPEHLSGVFATQGCYMLLTKMLFEMIGRGQICKVRKLQWSDNDSHVTRGIAQILFLHCILNLPTLLIVSELFHHLNVMLFELGCSPLMHNEWGLTVCFVKSCASNVRALLKGAVDEGGREGRICTPLTFGPAVHGKWLKMPPLMCFSFLLHQWINQSAQILWSLWKKR